MAGETDLQQMLSTIAVDQQPGTFCFVTDDSDKLVEQAYATVREPEGLSLVVPIEVAREHGFTPEFQASWLTLRVHSALEAVGLTAAFSKALGEASIPCNVIAGAHHDHVLVPVDRTAGAIAAIEALRSQSI